MTTERLVVRRSPWRPFVVALAALPMLAVAYDFSTGGRILRELGALVYGTKDVEAFELREVFWTALFYVAGVLGVLWGIRELAVPRAVVSADADGIRLVLRGPWLPASRLAWSAFDDARPATVDLVGDRRPALVVTVLDGHDLPDDPWGARWTSPNTLAIDVTGWDLAAADVARALMAQSRSLRRAGLEPPLA